MEERYPIYAEADIVVQTRDVGKEAILREALAAIATHQPTRTGEGE
jgi:shikimate kinase